MTAGCLAATIWLTVTCKSFQAGRSGQQALAWSYSLPCGKEHRCGFRRMTLSAVFRRPRQGS